MTIPRTLILHAGGSKTGSSAIQNFLELRSDSLRQYGFDYLNRINIDSEHQIQSGNGALLHAKLVAPDSSDAEIDHTVSSFIGGCTQAICSSEFFADMDACAWRRLRDSASRLGLTLKILLFVRNVIPFFLSAYDQAIKYHGEWRPFENCALEGVWQHVNVLRVLATEFPRNVVEVIHYDRVGDCHLIPRFLGAIGVESEFELTVMEKNRRVNRSLSEQERALLRNVNMSLGSEYAGEFFGMLMKAHPYCPTDRVEIDAGVTSALFARYSDDVDWINATWFEGRNVVGVLPLPPAGSPSRGDADVAPVDIQMHAGELKSGAPGQEDLYSEILQWCIARFELSVEKGIHTVVDQMRRIDWENSANPVIPADFDPVAYLLLNIDILKADSRPFDHYIKYGQFESARLWQWRQL